MLRSRFHVLPLLPFLTFLMQPAAPSAAQNGHFSLSGSAVHVYNLVGKVEVVPGSGASVLVDLTQQGKDGARLGTKTFNENGTFFVIARISDGLNATQRVSSAPFVVVPPQGPGLSCSPASVPDAAYSFQAEPEI